MLIRSSQVDKKKLSELVELNILYDIYDIYEMSFQKFFSLVSGMNDNIIRKVHKGIFHQICLIF